MKLVIGSVNPTKVQAVERVFTEWEVTGSATDSGVSHQPMSDEQTKQGAVNRALLALDKQSADAGAGLEGGVMSIENKLYLCNWGALTFPSGTIFTASGARIELPDEFLPELQAGKELGEIMEAYAKKTDVRMNEGAIGIFTNGQIDRRAMFTHVMQLLRGQMEYWIKG
jgi:inosine/xanthosine triphosphatase